MMPWCQNIIISSHLTHWFFMVEALMGKLSCHKKCISSNHRYILLKVWILRSEHFHLVAPCALVLRDEDLDAQALVPQKSDAGASIIELYFSRFGSCGQNIFISSHPVPWFFVVESWWMERSLFNYGASNNISEVLNDFKILLKYFKILFWGRIMYYMLQ